MLRLMLTRDDILGRLVPALRERADVNAAWLGGSDAFHAADALSDIDLCVDVADGAAHAVLDAIDAELRALSPVVARLDVPEPAWHGHSQRFWRLRDAPETLLVDAAAMERGNPRMRFSERETHGEPAILFDKLGIVAPAPLDVADNTQRMAARRAALRIREAIFGSFPMKEAARGRALDALHFHHAMLLQPLVEALRMRWCPERFGFGMRYLHRDLPPGVADRLTRLAFVSDLDDLRAKAPEAREWLREELSREA